jgi:adenylate cyclase
MHASPTPFLRDRGAWFVGLWVALILTLFSLAGLPGNLDRAWFDFLSRKHATPSAASPEAVMVLIDEATIQEAATRRGDRWPWPRGTFAALIAAIHQAGARTIVVDLLFLEPSEDAAEDETLGAMIQATGAILARLPKATGVFEALAPTGLVNYPSDNDSIIRRYAFKDSLVAASGLAVPDHTPLLRWYGGLDQIHPDQKRSALLLVAEGRRIQEALQQSGVDEFDANSVRKALPSLPRQEFQNALKDKIVFLGVNHAAGFDIKSFPVGAKEPGLLCHWTAWSNARLGHWFREIPGFSPVTTSLILIAAFGLFWSMARLPRLAGLAASLLVLLVFSSWLGFFNSLYLPVALPATGTVLAFTVLAARHWQSESAEKRRIGELFGSYVAPEVLDYLQEHPGRVKLGGERCEASVYFSDLAGFTDLSEKLPPEDLIALMNDYFGEMGDILIREGGYLDKYIGDAVMGVFGVPRPLPGHALAACRAALSCRDRLAEMADSIHQRHGVRVFARIGINTGPVVAGNLGSVRKVSYTVMGDTVNLASRLEGANKPYGTTILLGEATEAAAREGILTRPVDLLRVKGKEQAVMTHELLALSGSLPGPVLIAAEHQRTAYTHYRARRFAEALQGYKAAAAILTDDTLVDLYRQRCLAFLSNPPPSDWDGVWVLKEK